MFQIDKSEVTKWHIFNPDTLDLFVWAKFNINRTESQYNNKSLRWNASLTP